MSRRELLRLWALAEGGPTIDLDHFVPDNEVGKPFHHAGRNSIPTLPHWRRFQKRFARMTPDADTLVGYNEGPTRSWMGPGYFMLRRSEIEQHEKRGGVFVDYLSVPIGDVPDGWPTVIPNEKGLQRFVYAGTRDFMRRVSDRVSVGMPFKGDKMLPYPFVLVRL